MGKKLFDYVIGNPPYQDNTVGDSNTATPIYNSFMDSAYEIGDKVMLITPARFLFNAGYTPKSWNDKMLNDEHLKVIAYYSNSADVFKDVDIKGGVAITYHDTTKTYGSIRVFSQFKEVNTILKKVLNHNQFQGLNEIIITSFAYHFTKVFYDENPSLKGRSSKGHDFDIQSNAFDIFPEVFYDEAPNEDDYICILGRKSNVRCKKYIKKQYVCDVSNLNSFKVFYPKATGTGQFGETLPEAVIGNPKDGATVTYFSIGHFGSKDECLHCIKYTKSKFARTLLSTLKVTQDNTPAKWRYVPLQDFTSSSDIDWSQSIHEIDLQLYRKYDLSEDEMAFIESHVKEMT